MKKILLLILMLVLVGQVSKAQMYDIYIPSGVILTDNQWHQDGYCIVQANDNRYLVVSPNGYEYYMLQPFDMLAFNAKMGDVALSFKPCFYNNSLGWFVEGRWCCYFWYAGFCTILNYYPVYYDYHYAFHLVRHLNMRNYYWHRPPRYMPRPLPHHHGPGFGRPPHRNQGHNLQNRPPQRSGNGHSVQNRPPQRSGNGHGVQNKPPQRSGNGHGVQNRPPQRSGNGSGAQNRPPQRSGNGHHSSGRSGGASSHRR